MRCDYANVVGMGVVSPLGNSVDVMYDNLLKGVSCFIHRNDKLDDYVFIVTAL